MLNQILKFAVFSSIALFLRTRWKRLSTCIAAILVAVYAHSEYLDYVAALPVDTREAVGASQYVLAGFVLKNSVIIVAILAVVVPELRQSQRRRRRARAAESSRKTVAKASPKLAESGVADETGYGDGFDFLRHRRKLRTRNEQIIGDKLST